MQPNSALEKIRKTIQMPKTSPTSRLPYAWNREEGLQSTAMSFRIYSAWAKVKSQQGLLKLTGPSILMNFEKRVPLLLSVVLMPKHYYQFSDLCPDFEYYLSQQIFPPIERLCAPIEGTDRARLAECLGKSTVTWLFSIEHVIFRAWSFAVSKFNEHGWQDFFCIRLTDERFGTIPGGSTFYCPLSSLSSKTTLPSS